MSWLSFWHRSSRPRPTATREPQSGATPEYPAVDSPRQQDCSEALRLWLRWNEQFQGVTEALYEGQGDLARMRDTLDQLDQLRYAAVRMSRQLLENPRPQSVEVAPRSRGSRQPDARDPSY